MQTISSLILVMLRPYCQALEKLLTQEPRHLYTQLVQMLGQGSWPNLLACQRILQCAHVKGCLARESTLSSSRPHNTLRVYAPCISTGLSNYEQCNPQRTLFPLLYQLVIQVY
jgi:hypothetical protein